MHPTHPVRPCGPAATDSGRLTATWFAQRALLGRYDRLLVSRLGRHLGQRLLEVGCGSGTMTRLLLDRDLVVAIDSDPASVRQVQERLGGSRNLVCLRVDITESGECLRGCRLDSALCSNVLEHVADDELALRNIAAALAEGGALVVLVPAMPALYCTLDIAAGHYRRYSPEELRRKLRAAGFVEKGLCWLNLPGALGWLVAGKLARRATIPDWQLRLFDRLARPAMALESRLPLRWGLSLVAVGVRCGQAPDEVRSARRSVRETVRGCAGGG